MKHSSHSSINETTEVVKRTRDFSYILAPFYRQVARITARLKYEPKGFYVESEVANFDNRCYRNF